MVGKDGAPCARACIGAMSSATQRSGCGLGLQPLRRDRPSGLSNFAHQRAAARNRRRPIPLESLFYISVPVWILEHIEKSREAIEDSIALLEVVTRRRWGKGLKAHRPAFGGTWRDRVAQEKRSASRSGRSPAAP
jgi:hypothetical protein